MRKYERVVGGGGYKVARLHAAKGGQPREVLSLFKFEELMIKRLGLMENEGGER